MKKIIVTTIARNPIEHENTAYGDKTTTTSSFWTLSNGLEVQVHYYKAEGLYGSYKSISVSPFIGQHNMPYVDVRDGLAHVMDAVQAWVNRRDDRHEWKIRYQL